MGPVRKRALWLLRIKPVPNWFSSAEGTPSYGCIREVKAVAKHNLYFEEVNRDSMSSTKQILQCPVSLLMRQTLS